MDRAIAIVLLEGMGDRRIVEIVARRPAVGVDLGDAVGVGKR